ncbi:MAG TPA: glycosyltransferase, partial [Ilumatobacteraceae bacterium]
GMNEAGTERLRTVASGLGVRVHVAGRVPQDQLESLLATADALVQPSLEEGFGLPVAEAMAAGIPVAVSTGGSLPEVVDGAVPLFDPLDEEAIARAIDDAVGRQEQARPVRPTELDLARAAHELVVTTAGAPRHRKRRP